LIRIGIECSRKKLYCDLLTHPKRYFFVQIADGHPTLCIRTCDSHGEDITTHMVECFFADSKGRLIPIFHESLENIALSPKGRETNREGDQYPISRALGKAISTMPDLIEWIINSILDSDRHIIIASYWEIQGT